MQCRRRGDRVAQRHPVPGPIQRVTLGWWVDSVLRVSASNRVAGVVLSDSLQPFEWLSRSRGHHPQAKLQTTHPARVPVVDEGAGGWWTTGVDHVVLTVRHRPNLDVAESVLRCVLMAVGIEVPTGSVGHV